MLIQSLKSGRSICALYAYPLRDGTVFFIPRLSGDWEDLSTRELVGLVVGRTNIRY